MCLDIILYVLIFLLRFNQHILVSVVPYYDWISVYIFKWLSQCLINICHHFQSQKIYFLSNFHIYNIITSPWLTDFITESLYLWLSSPISPPSLTSYLTTSHVSKIIWCLSFSIHYSESLEYKGYLDMKVAEDWQAGKRTGSKALETWYLCQEIKSFFLKKRGAYSIEV